MARRSPSRIFSVLCLSMWALLILGVAAASPSSASETGIASDAILIADADQKAALPNAKVSPVTRAALEPRPRRGESTRNVLAEASKRTGKSSREIMRMLRRRAEEREREVPDVSHSPDGYPEEMKVRSAGKERDDIPEDDHVRDVDAAVAERLLAEHREQRDDLGTLLRISGFPAKHPETHLDAVLRFLDAEAAVAKKGGGPERRQLASSRVQVRLLARAIKLSSPSFSTPSPFSQQAATR